MTRARLVVAITLASYLCACTTLRPLPESAGPPAAAVHVGDSVRIVTSDGRRHEFKVSGLSEGSVCGDAGAMDRENDPHAARISWMWMLLCAAILLAMLIA